MRVRSQAVTLGSADTSGSDVEDGYVDTDLEDFVVDDDQPLTEVDSSLPSPSAVLKRQPRPIRASQLSIVRSSQELPELGTLLVSTAANKHSKRVSPVENKEIGGEKENRTRANTKNRRRVVSDDEDD
jgi:hypothetical protein